MFHRPTSSKRRQTGLSLAELLVATMIMGLISASFGALAMSIQMANEHATSKNRMGQSARIILGRVERTIGSAHANESFPGVRVVTYSKSTYDFPQVLAVWVPPASGPAGSYPQVDELVFFAANPDSPNRLLEIHPVNDSSAAPAFDSDNLWRTLLTQVLEDNETEVIPLFDQLRVGKVSSSDSDTFSTLRFDVRVRPNDDQLASARAGDTNWTDLPWTNSINGNSTGLRQVWVSFSYQIVPSDDVDEHDAMQDQSVPFFGSSAIYYQVSK